MARYNVNALKQLSVYLQGLSEGEKQKVKTAIQKYANDNNIDELRPADVEAGYYLNYKKYSEKEYANYCASMD